jgi:hypothetical protein
MLHLVVLEQSLRSIQCLTATSVHYYLLQKPLQAYEFATMAINKAQNLYHTHAFQDDSPRLELWNRIYRVALLIEGELVVPLNLANSNSWNDEDSIPLPVATDVWSCDTVIASPQPDTPATTDSQPDKVMTYLLAEIAMRRMLNRNTTSISSSMDGTVEYAPVIARELEAQLEQWFSVLPDSLRFPRTFGSTISSHMSPQATFLCTQWWACMVSISWPSIKKALELPYVSDTLLQECKIYFHSYEQFIKSATASLHSCPPNRWTLYAR